MVEKIAAAMTDEVLDEVCPGDLLLVKISRSGMNAPSVLVAFPSLPSDENREKVRRSLIEAVQQRLQETGVREEEIEAISISVDYGEDEDTGDDEEDNEEDDDEYGFEDDDSDDDAEDFRF